MTDTTTKVREQYSATELTDRIKSALATIAPEGQGLTVVQLGPLDQFLDPLYAAHGSATSSME